jgi:hypothetical protein
MTTSIKPANRTNNKEKQLTKKEYKAILLESYKNKGEVEFDINKVAVSKNDPVVSTVNKILAVIK